MPENEPRRYHSRITSSYVKLRCINLGRSPQTDGRLELGPVTVKVEGDSSFSVEGSYVSNGLLSGMAKLYARVNFQPDDEFGFFVPPDDTQTVVLESLPDRPQAATQPTPAQSPAVPPKQQSVFASQNLRHVHIEAFEPTNLVNWEPQTEPDVYLVFGVLQEFTDYRYCCGASKAILDKLGASYADAAKPDAILIHRVTDEYRIAEWKKWSSEFRLNHKPSEVDVLVCWIDDESDRSRLPVEVLALKTIARSAAQAQLTEG